MKLVQNQIKDAHFKDAPVNRHPCFQPYLVFNDQPGAVTAYFESFYDDEEKCKKVHGVGPRAMKQFAPDLYYYPEHPNYRIIEVKVGGFARIPHAFFTVSSRDGKPVKLSIRDENGL